MRSLATACAITAATIILLALAKLISLLLVHFFGGQAAFVVLVTSLFLIAWIISYTLEKEDEKDTDDI